MDSFVLIIRAQNVKLLETQTRKSALELWTLSLKTWCKWVGLFFPDAWDTNLTFRMWRGRHRWYPGALLKIFTQQHLTSEWREFVDAYSLFCNHQPELQREIFEYKYPIDKVMHQSSQSSLFKRFWILRAKEQESKQNWSVFICSALPYMFYIDRRRNFAVRA